MRRILSGIVAALLLAGVAQAEDRAYRPVLELPTGYTLNRVTDALAFSVDSITAMAATLAPFIEAVRLTCSAACFVTLSATDASSQSGELIRNISGSYLPADVPVTYRSPGGEYVIVIGVGASGTVYVQALSR